MHLVSGFPKLAQKQYKRRHAMFPEEFIGNCARSIDWKVPTGGMSIPADVVENDEVELYCDLTIQTDMTVGRNRPDIILL